ncbi:MAG TPA: 50S ribosomal protein L10 [Clostridia bacterium]|nr:50S ribosomal protein L10 [Clostridia bacterium]
MANAKIIEVKAQQVSEISEKIARAQSVILFDYRGLTVEQVTELRNEMRKNGIEYVVLKNSLVERAAKKDSIDERVHDYLKGPTAYAFGYNDAVAPAKILKDAVKKYKKCELKGGIVNGKVFNAAEVNTLADLPSREQLIARLLGSMMSPISGLAVALDQIAKKRSEGAAE